MIAALMATRSGTNAKALRLMEGNKGTDMPKLQNERIIETPTEARQAEPGPSILKVLVISVALAAIVLGAVWIIFFRT
jgi:hypothetical protein